MKHTLYTDIVKYWKFINETSKLKMLQEYENQNAKENNRQERKLVLEDFNPQRPDAYSVFSQRKPDIITIFKNKKFVTCPEHALSIAYHEGLHATIFDYFTQKNITLKTYKKLNTKELYDIHRLDKSFYPVSATANFSSEENYVLHESLCNTADNFLNSVESHEDYKLMTIPYAEKLREYIIYKKTYDVHREVNPRVPDDKVIPKDVVKLANTPNSTFEQCFPTCHIELKQNSTQVNNHLEKAEDIMDTIILKEMARLDINNNTKELLTQIKKDIPNCKF